MSAEHSLTVSQRAMMAARLMQSQEPHQFRRRAEKARWMTDARAGFYPGSRRDCAICGRYSGLTHAHHIFPLALQFECDATAVPDHDHVWLCPTHHAAIHRHIDGLVAGRDPAPMGLPPDEADAISSFNVRFVEKWSAKWRD